MKFDEKRQYVQKKRGEVVEEGCKSCKKLSPWLILKGGPSLYDMLRSNVSLEELDQAMEERGWYCRACIAKQAREASTTHLVRCSERARSNNYRRDCEKFMEVALESPQYKSYFVEGLNEARHVNRMMGALESGQASDPEEAFFMVSAWEQDGW